MVDLEIFTAHQLKDGAYYYYILRIMFCVSRDTRVSYGWCLPIQEYFCAVKKYTEKAERSKCFWYPKRKLG